jgi:histidinol-phosphate phosphatase family protein
LKLAVINYLGGSVNHRPNPGIARGYFPESALLAVEERSRQLLAEVGVALAGFYYCPHHPDGIVQEFTKNYSCRKPESGMLLHAATRHDIDIQSWFIGDILNNVEAGRLAGCKTILIDKGNPVAVVTIRDRHIIRLLILPKLDG